MRTAKLNLKQINCVDVLYLMKQDSLLGLTAKEKNQLNILKELGTTGNNFMREIDGVTKQNSITGQALDINNGAYMQ